MTLVYAVGLDFVTQKTNVKVWKIDGSVLMIYDMIIAGFLL